MTGTVCSVNPGLKKPKNRPKIGTHEGRRFRSTFIFLGMFLHPIKSLVKLVGFSPFSKVFPLQLSWVQPNGRCLPLKTYRLFIWSFEHIARRPGKLFKSNPAAKSEISLVIVAFPTTLSFHSLRGGEKQTEIGFQFNPGLVRKFVFTFSRMMVGTAPSTFISIRMLFVG